MNLTTYSRRKAHEVNIGGVKVGSSHPIQVQSMTNTPTADTVSSVEQVKRIADAGAPIVRLTAQGRKEGENLENIVARLREDGIRRRLLPTYILCLRWHQLLRVMSIRYV